VFGIPDDRLGEVVCAAITITKGSSVDEETVKNYCNGNVSYVIVIYYYEVQAYDLMRRTKYETNLYIF